MKSVNISVEFKDPIKELQSQLQRSGARNVDIRRSYNGDVEVRYTMKAIDPEKEITAMLNNAGAESVRASSNYNGARFDFRVNDMIDDREFKRKLIEVLRRSGYRSF